MKHELEHQLLQYQYEQMRDLRHQKVILHSSLDGISLPTIQTFFLCCRF